MARPAIYYQHPFVHRERVGTNHVDSAIYTKQSHQVRPAHAQEVNDALLARHHPSIRCPGGPLFGFVSQFAYCCSNHQWSAYGKSRGTENLPPLAHFLYHLLQTMEVSHATLVVALSYIHRLVDLNQCRGHVDVCGHCLATVCMVLASKFLEDDTRPNNRQWAREASMTTKELAAHERTVLEMLDYNLNFSVENFDMLKSSYVKDTLLVLWQKGGFVPLYTPTPIVSAISRHVTTDSVRTIQNSTVPMDDFSPASFTFTPEEYVCFLASRYSCAGFRGVSPKNMEEVVQYDRMRCENWEYWNILQELKSCTKVQM